MKSKIVIGSIVIGIMLMFVSSASAIKTKNLNYSDNSRILKNIRHESKINPYLFLVLLIEGSAFVMLVLLALKSTK
jgi:hypothetical protein